MKSLRLIFPGAALGCAASLTGFCAAIAEEPDGHALECYENAQTVFTSDVADIAEFDATAYGVTLQNTISYPEKNAILYQFGPRDILCVVVNE